MSHHVSTRFPLPNQDQVRSIDKFWQCFDGLLSVTELSEVVTSLSSAQKSLLISNLIEHDKQFIDLTISELTQLIQDIDSVQSKCA